MADDTQNQTPDTLDNIVTRDNPLVPVAYHKHNDTDGSPKLTFSESISGSVPVSSGGTGTSTLTAGVMTGSNSVVILENPLSVPLGGSGKTNLTANNVLVGNGISPVTLVAPSTAGGIFVSQGSSVDPSFVTSSPYLARLRVATDSFSRAAYTATGAGAASVGAWGADLNPSAGAIKGSAKAQFRILPDFHVSSNANLFTTAGLYYAMFAEQYIGTPTSVFIGLGYPTVGTTGHTFTDDHIGFKTVTAAGTCSLYASVGSSSTETASAALTTLAQGDVIEVYIQVLSQSQTNFYWSKNLGSLSAVTSLTYNAQGSTGLGFQASISTDNTNVQSYLNCMQLVYSQ